MYLHQLVQSRLCSEDGSLHDLFVTLHHFCLSLQLDCLHAEVGVVGGWGLSYNANVSLLYKIECIFVVVSGIGCPLIQPLLVVSIIIARNLSVASA